MWKECLAVIQRKESLASPPKHFFHLQWDRLHPKSAAKRQGDFYIICSILH